MRLERTERVYFEGRQLDFFGSPMERRFDLSVKLDGDFILEVRRDDSICNKKTVAYNEAHPPDAMTIVAGCAFIAVYDQ